MPRRRPKYVSPTLVVPVTQKVWDAAVRSASGACVIADGIRTQYPHLTHVEVDTRTIRVSDRKKGVRYTYLTPEPAVLILTGFDQGWKRPPFEDVVIRRAVQVRVITSRNSQSKEAWRAARIAELEAKEADGTLTPSDKKALHRFRNPLPKVERPTSVGPMEVAGRGRPVIVGGRDIPKGPDFPNLLRGRNRHFGARLADPGIAFREAVDKAVAERLAQPSNV